MNSELIPNVTSVRKKPLSATRKLAILIILTMVPVIAWLIFASEDSRQIRHDEEAIQSKTDSSAQFLAEVYKSTSARSENELDTLKYCQAMLDGLFDEADQVSTKQIHAFKLPANYTDRGDAKFMQGRFTEALSDYRQAVKLPDPESTIQKDHSTNYYRCGDTEYRLKNYQQSVRDYRIAVAQSIYPPNRFGSIEIAMAEIFRALGLYQVSANFYRNVHFSLSPYPPTER